MTRERNDVPYERVEKEKERGDKPAQKTGSANEDDEDEAPPEKEILVSVVDEIVEVESTAETTADTVEPQGSNRDFSNSELSVQTVPSLGVEQSSEQVNNIIRPQRRIEDQLVSKLEVSTLGTVGVERTETPAVEQVQPLGRVQSEWDGEVTLAERIESKRINETVSNMTKPHQSTKQLTDRDGFLEIDEKDPVFSWSGGSPFGSDRPRFVVHVDNGKVSSLQLLQRLLRDTYKEVRGGEPGAETVEFVANEPRIPTVQKNIVTLDLSADEWEPSLRNNSPGIEGQGGDIVPKLRQIAAELYTGELGYFVLNVPADFEHRYRRKGFHSKLIEMLADQKVSKEKGDPSSLVEKLRASPVVLAEPRIDDEADFFEKVSRYFSLTPVTDGTSVSQIEEVQDRVLKKNDWRRVVLTERQGENGEGESNEHYFWKAAIGEGLARKMWEKNDQGYNEFDPFLKEEILSNNVIKTEVKDLDGVNAYPDIYINHKSHQKWIADGLSEFLDFDTEQGISPPVVIEFETGRSEGAFNFRKIRDTLEKYSRDGVTICLVVPDRLLYRGRKRATMIRTLVKTWDEANQAEAKLFTPTLEDGICTGLQSASSVINEVYGDENDE